MGKEVKSIELGFENCEVIEFPRNVLGDVHFDNFSFQIKRVASNSISKVEFVDTVVLEIYKEGNTEYAPFGFEDEKTAKFERITHYNDITSITICYEDDSEEFYWVDYHTINDNLGEESDYQKTYLSDLGNLYLVIDKEKGIEDFFDKETINDKDAVSFTKEMYDIGIEPQYPQNYSKDNLPDMYRYVYLEEGLNQVLAVRVYDNNTGWRYIYENSDREIVDVPEKFIYPTSKIDEFINSGKFSYKKIITDYPLPEEAPAENSPFYKYYKESKEAIEKIKNKYYSFSLIPTGKPVGLSDNP